MSDLEIVLKMISDAKTPEELLAVAPKASLLSVADKAIARWSYSYAQEQLKEIA